jgi:hypothetical protein
MPPAMSTLPPVVRIVRARALTLSVVFAAGCMTQSRVAVVTIRNGGAELPAPRAVPADDGELAKLGPLTRIRGLGSDGGTPWQEAGQLWISDAGLVRTPVRLGSMVNARVEGLDDEEHKWLDEMKPRDARAQVMVGLGGTTLWVWRSERLIPWIVSFLARAQAAGKPLGSWQLMEVSALGFAATSVDGGPLDVDARELLAAGSQASEIRAGHGIRWPERGAFELEYFDAGKSAFALVPLVPLAIIGGIIYAAMGGGSFSDDGPGDTYKGGPTLLLTPDAAARAAPLFSAGARRRSFVTFVAAADGAGTIPGDARGGLSLAVRMTELLELGAFARGLSTAELDGGLGRTERLVAGGRLGLHVAVGPASRWAVAGGADVGATVAGPRLRMAGFYAGVRRTFGRNAFVGVYPLVPTWFSGDERAPGTRFRWMPSLEIGLEL